MKSANATQPDLFASETPVVPLKPQADVRPRKAKEKKKGHRTSSGDRCEGAIWIPGLGQSLVDHCGEWITTSKF